MSDAFTAATATGKATRSGMQASTALPLLSEGGRAMTIDGNLKTIWRGQWLGSHSAAGIKELEELDSAEALPFEDRLQCGKHSMSSEVRLGVILVTSSLNQRSPSQ